MQRSSDSIASLAAALAKAQIELSNPEKSLVGTIEPRMGEGGQRLFRYAPLSSGLEIVRKTLGQHEIATVQTTAIDQAAGTVNLTTVLAHASGEWIASDWPVCAISETATPHRMGAALTYARRYALFTLVGIAGEDDLDAPDLVAPTGPASATEKPDILNQNGRLSRGQGHGGPRTPVRRNGKNFSIPAKATLAPDKSAALRHQLVSELEALTTVDAATTWAHRILAAKNTLTATDARRVEEAFQLNLVAHGHGDAETIDATLSSTESDQTSLSKRPRTAEQSERPASRGVDKSALTLPEPRRIRDKDHVRFVAQQPCLICGRQPSDAHHLRFAQNRALGRKVSDEFTVPLCRGHHRELHRHGDEAAWWKNADVDPMLRARALWLATHPLPATPDKTGINGKNSVVAVSTDKTNAKRDRPVSQRGPNYKPNPIAAAPHRPR
jgi:hypothetical protein